MLFLLYDRLITTRDIHKEPHPQSINRQPHGHSAHRMTLLISLKHVLRVASTDGVSFKNTSLSFPQKKKIISPTSKNKTRLGKHSMLSVLGSREAQSHNRGTATTEELALVCYKVELSPGNTVSQNPNPRVF